MYILTTDADVMFTPESVEALLDLMSRDPTIGKTGETGVCMFLVFVTNLLLFFSFSFKVFDY